MDCGEAFAAIESLCSGERDKVKHAAEWLSDLKNSPAAWQICHRLIGERRTIASVSYASQLLRQKVVDSFNELPPETYEQFRDCLIEHLKNVDWANPEETVIMTQLSLALVDLYLQVPRWPNGISRLIAEFTQQPNDRTGVLLCLLKLFPEEAKNPQVNIGQNRRNQVESELAALNVELLNYIGQVCQAYQNNSNVISRAITCLGAWLQNKEVPTDLFSKHPILLSTISVLQHPDSADFELHNAAGDLMCSALQRIERYTNEDFWEHTALAKVLHSAVLGMVDAFKAADENEKHTYARIFVEAAETFAISIALKPDQGFGNLKMLDIMVAMAECADTELIDMSFGFWYHFGDCVYEEIEDADNDEYCSTFRPYVRRYIRQLLMHCRHEPDDEFVPGGSFDDFAEFRGRICDAFNDVCFIIGYDECLQIIADYYSTCEKTWVEIEAVVFFLKSFIRGVRDHDASFIPDILEAVINTGNDCHPLLSCSMIGLVKNAESWISQHPACLDAVMEWLIARLKDERFAVKAARAVHIFCTANRKNLAKYFERLCQIITEYETDAALGNLADASGDELTQGCASLLSNETEDFVVKFEYLVSRPIERLHQITTNEKLRGEQFQKKQKGTAWEIQALTPVTWLNRLSSIYRYVQPYDANGEVSQQIGRLLEETWGALLVTLKLYMADVRVCEQSCRAMRFVIRSLGARSAPLAKELINVMVEIYQIYPHSCFLYVGSIMVDEYGGQKIFQQDLLKMIEMLATGTVRILQDDDAFVQHPDTVDDFLRMGIRFLQTAPSVFIGSPVADLYMQCGTMAIRVDHRDVVNSVSLFFQEVISFLTERRKKSGEPKERAAAVQAGFALYERYGAQLTEETVKSCLFRISRQNRGQIAYILDGVRLACGGKFDVFLRQTFEHLPHDTLTSATREQLREFHGKMITATHRDHMAQLIEQLCEYYR
ncbi:hypothetical protein QR680_011925 [Steinernema hermaphroditum]|uniref:Importin N-terminal domain-containing protein n=1 Tax=Steinernema hermaphroditum TaxID=289476 RepID=A0AA39LZL4_9BILA|nr:hypothetical protein QR680_011925 [Steinernema hermaphroditum]